MKKAVVSRPINMETSRERILREVKDEPEMLKELISQSERLYNEGKFTDAREILSVLAEAVPENYEVWNSLGVVQFSLHELEEAEKSFGRALSINRYYLESYINLAELYKLVGMYDKAHTYQATYLKLCGEIETVLNLKTAMIAGWMHYTNGNYREAEQIFRKVADTDTENPQICLDLHLAFLKLRKCTGGSIDESERGHNDNARI